MSFELKLENTLKKHLGRPSGRGNTAHLELAIGLVTLKGLLQPIIDVKQILKMRDLSTDLSGNDDRNDRGVEQMTHPTFDNLPGRLRFDVKSEDPYLRETLSQYAYCQLFPDYQAELAALDSELSGASMIVRLNSALDAEEDELRVDSARRLVSRMAPDSESILMRFLNSVRMYDRMSLVPLAALFDSERVLAKVIELATQDPSPNVRSEACLGFRGKDLKIAIPVLLQVMHEAGADVDPLDQTTPPSAMAALVLDRLLGTSFMLNQPRGELSVAPTEMLEAKAKEMLKVL